MGKLSDFQLQSYLEKGYTTFVETGTGRGDGLAYAASYGFTRLFSTEIYKPLYDELVPHFAGDKRIKIYNLHGPDFIKEILTNHIESDEKVVWFFDSHYPSSDVTGAAFDSEPDLDIRLPLQRELEMVKNFARVDDVMIIDDARIYLHCNPPVKNLDEIGLGHIAQYNDAKFVYDLFSETHDIRVIHEDTGYILVRPKHYEK